ncbi:putative NLI-interacting factor [Leishmania major strain Friedlin]|uniref:Mitochondrial import inner membrane translocase subunit TIM50 n=1 Tax=Leishmania major TaxID=5664 RepID=Q4Q377_LEIMA|nr:putative NLI-interacting factor [Leishmania major strain Friedlin]CAG9581972.1 PTP1-interacting_protein_-_39_kDa_-_putative [Leishmania major strain Friedlin]CAJ07835.1 putative NLI-interacting factor [Leishmania major strain Friedlin]|eukprot:XP_001686221.1 putative NLI-interacting factor [Leishmania major strain Friedlin]
MRARSLLRQQASAATLQPLRSVVAIGLRQEFDPHWPLPLPPPLPMNKQKHTLVLDIDETLIHTYAMGLHDDSKDHTRDPALQGVSLIDYNVLLRPHLKEFLEEVNQLFEVVFWTAGTASYCCAVLDALEQQVMQLPRSFYSYVELAKESRKMKSSTSHTNFYALSRTQTLEQQGYMKYLPMLGRKMSSVVMLDDNVRSFPLTPRNGIRIDAFDPDDHVLQRYIFALRRVQKEKPHEMEAALVQCLQQGQQEIARLEKDRALLDVLPVLRAVAQVPAGQDVTKELDHWRDLDYVRCDDFMETMNVRSAVRQQILGVTLPERRSTPIPAQKLGFMNSGFLESANAEMTLHHTRSVRHSKL